MQKWLDSAAALPLRASSGLELENQTDCVRDLEEIKAQEKSFTVALEELRTLDPLLVDFTEPGVRSGEKVEKMQLKNTEVKHQLDAYREVLQRCVLMSSIIHFCFRYVEPNNECVHVKFTFYIYI